MKLANLLVIAALLTFSDLQAQTCKDGLISVLSRKRDIFYFKVCNDFIGAQVEVFSSTGELLATSPIMTNKALIDFYFERPGKYSIKFKKGDEETSFEFTKEAPPPLAVSDVDYHIIIAQQ